MSRRERLKQKLDNEYKKLRDEGKGQYAAFDELMEMRVKISEVFSFDTLRDIIMRRSGTDATAGKKK